MPGRTDICCAAIAASGSGWRVLRDERVGAAFWLARNQLAHARMFWALYQPGDTERARTLLDETLGIAQREGYQHLEREARNLLNPGS